MSKINKKNAIYPQFKIPGYTSRSDWFFHTKSESTSSSKKQGVIAYQNWFQWKVEYFFSTNNQQQSKCQSRKLLHWFIPCFPLSTSLINNLTNYANIVLYVSIEYSYFVYKEKKIKERKKEAGKMLINHQHKN